MTGQETIVQRLLARLTTGLPTSSRLFSAPDLHAPHRPVARALDADELPTYAVMVVQNNEDDARARKTA